MGRAVTSEDTTARAAATKVRAETINGSDEDEDGSGQSVEKAGAGVI
jgi:hypothetical protein